jgi:hypothetical protein
VLAHLPSALIPNPGMEGGDLMTNPIQSDPDRLRLALDNGEEVELDGGTLVLGDEQSPSVLLRLAPWRARSVGDDQEGGAGVVARAGGRSGDGRGGAAARVGADRPGWAGEAVHQERAGNGAERGNDRALRIRENRAEAKCESTNMRNGTRSKTVVSDAVGEVEINVPRDREGTFEPQIAKKRQRRLADVDEVVLSLYAKGLTTGEISAHFAEIYGASVSKETVSRITDKAIAEMNEWANRPLDAVYAAVFIDAIVVKVRDGQVANRPVYAAVGVTVDGPGCAGPVGRHRR